MMIPRLLVPVGARPPAAADSASTRRRPSTLDERTLVPSNLPLLELDTRSTIPSNLPLDSIAARVVVPRDVNVEAVQRPDDSTLPAQPSDMDERITVPIGAAPPEILPELPPISEELVERDILQTGEVSFLPPEVAPAKTLERLRSFSFSTAVYIAFILLLYFQPFGPYQRTREQEEIGRKQITVLLPPGALDSLKPSAPPAPHESVKVDPKVLKRVAPPVETPIQPPAPAPVPEQPKRELPSAPTPQIQQPQPQASMPVPKTDTSKAPLKLEVPTTPTPSQGLLLPNQLSPGGSIRDAARNTRPSAPVPMGGGGQLPGGGGGGGGGGGRGSAYAGVQMLTDDEGIDFNDYLHRVYVTVKQNWFAVMPASVSLGDQGVVSLRFRITKNGVVPDGEPRQVFSSGKEPLDRAAYSSIRASTPFQPLPPGFKADYIELQFTYYYNLRPPNQ